MFTYWAKRQNSFSYIDNAADGAVWRVLQDGLMRLASLTHQAERSERVIEGKPKAKLFCTLTILFCYLCAWMKLAPQFDKVEDYGKI